MAGNAVPALTAADFAPGGELRALHHLQKNHIPSVYGATPYWRPKAPGIWRQVEEPEWNWSHPGREESAEVSGNVLLDCNGAFLAPLSGTELAHGALLRTGPIPTPGPRQVLPGYYLIGNLGWADPRIFSPLGQATMPAQIWVAAPTLQLLLELAEGGHVRDITIYDSWTCDQKCRLTGWAAWLREVRLLAMDTDEERRRLYPVGWKPECADAVKRGYSIAIQLMAHEPKKGENGEKGEERKSGVFRPDWTHAIRAQHKANIWRKAWNCLQKDIPVLYMGNTDEVELPAWAVVHLIDMDRKIAPIKIDLTGRQLGSFKIKSKEEVEDA